MAIMYQPPDKYMVGMFTKYNRHKCFHREKDAKMQHLLIPIILNNLFQCGTLYLQYYLIWHILYHVSLSQLYNRVIRAQAYWL